MIKYVTGNLLEAEENIIGQQVNAQGVMGAGLAKQIRNKYPVAYKEYMKVCGDSDYDSDLLGRTQLVQLNEGSFIANLFGQLGYGRGKIHTDYNSLKRALRTLKDFAVARKLSVALPFGLGCGLAGGSWEIVSKIIEKVFEDYEVTIYKLG